MTSNDIKKIACSKWGRYKVKGPFTSPLKFHRGVEMASLLGKQNVASLLEQTLANYYIYPTTTNSFNATGGSAKNTSIVTGHKYFIYYEASDLAPYGLYNTRQIFRSQNNSNTTNDIYHDSVNHRFTCFTSTATITESTVHFVMVTPTGTDIPSNHTITKMIILDLTELGLDTFTAQQFYDQYNHLFDQLANGEIVNKSIEHTLLKSVDLGTLNWFYGNDYENFYTSNYPDVENGVFNVLPNIHTNRYKTIPSYYRSSGLTTENKTISIWTSFKYLIVKDTSFTDAQEFKNSLNGVILYYEPATPITLSSGDYWFNQTGKTSNQTLGSLLLPKGITKITDANGVEVEFE